MRSDKFCFIFTIIAAGFCIVAPVARAQEECSPSLEVSVQGLVDAIEASCDCLSVSAAHFEKCVKKKKEPALNVQKHARKLGLSSEADGSAKAARKALLAAIKVSISECETEWENLADDDEEDAEDGEGDDAPESEGPH